MFKFEINQSVFCVRRTTQSYESCCGFCNGKGKITGLNKQEAVCPSCWGSGKGSKYTKDVFKVYSGIIFGRKIEEKIVENIFPSHFKDKTLSLTTYQIDGIPGSIMEEYIFTTEKEANDFAKKLNENVK
ncbi:MAG: hypothetical protein IJ880_05515 [Bacilli bacterium]|nr:hypothetical protein [Bacilli bacterium]